MRAECPDCHFLGDYPDKLVPVEGKNIICPKCKSPFFIKPEEPKTTEGDPHSSAVVEEKKILPNDNNKNAGTKRANKGNFWKGLALGIVGFVLWVFFSFIEAFSSGHTLTGLSFILMLFGPVLFWVVFPLKNKWYDKGEKKQFYLILTPIIILLLGFLVATFSPSDEKTQTETTQTKLELKLGEVLKTSKIEVAVISVEREKSYIQTTFDMTEEAEYGKEFLIVTVELKNIGDDSEYASPDDFSMSDSEGFRYDPEGGFLGAGIENALEHTELFPNEKVRGELVFEVPETSMGLIVKYNFAGILEKPKTASWIIE